MDSEKNQGGRPPKEETETRREKVKEMLLQGASLAEIAKVTGVSINTVQADIIYWKDYFRQLATNNPDVVRMQMSKVQEVLGEIDVVKKQYWDAYNKLMDEQKEQAEIKRKWREELEQLKADYTTAVENKNREEMRRLAKLIKETSRAPRLPSLHRAQLENLKLIMDRIDKEAKLLSLFNIGASQTKVGAISFESLKAIMIIFKNIIMDFVAEDQRRYAFERLRKVKIEEIKPEDVIDAEVVPEKKIGLNKIEPPTGESVQQDIADQRPEFKEPEGGLEELDI